MSSSSSSASTAVGSTTGEVTQTRSSRSTVAPTSGSAYSLTVSVTGRTPTTTAPVASASATASSRKPAGVSGHSGSCTTSIRPSSRTCAKATS